MPRHETSKRLGESPVTVEIDELVLHDFPSVQRHAIAAAFGDRLAELIREHGAPASPADLGTVGLDAGAFSVKPGARPEVIGRAAAQSVYQAVRGGER